MTRSLVLLAIFMLSWATPGHAQIPGSTNPPIPLPPFLTPRGTPEDQRNCRPDAARLCKEVIDNDDATLVDVMAPAALPDTWLRVLDALGSDGEPVVLGHADDERLRRMSVLDVVLNNADRKGGHVLVEPGGAVHGVDHGVSFHAEPKLRTVLWGWAGEPLTRAEVAVLETLRDDLLGSLGTTLVELVSRHEVLACRRRVDRLLHEGRLPYPTEGWPAIPWPPF